MDASNPVADSTRVRLSVLGESQRARFRQNLALLVEMAQNAERRLMPSLVERDVDGKTMQGEAKALMAETKKEPSNAPIDPSTLLEVLELVHESVPVCGLVNSKNQPLHPPGVNQTKGCVSVNRVFGGAERDREVLADALRFLPPEALREALASQTYTQGTAEGFAKRVISQMGRKCVSILKFPTGKVKPGRALKLLRDLMPVDLAKLPDPSEDVGVLVSHVETSAISSAGAPYWRSKAECYEDIMEVLPMVVEAIKTPGGLEKLQRSQTELFLAEVKNKQDRYEDPTMKTRPYESFPAHFQFLFSALSQPFCHALKLFPEGGTNAYGFSWAHGGATSVADWARAIPKRAARSYHYGDDADLYYRDSKGVLWRVAPDFKQMDGSVDSDTVKLSLKYILDCYWRAWPDTPPGVRKFWEVVAKLWAQMTSDPLFLIHGTGVYKKKSTDGIFSGVVGTTFFDTVKAAIVYSHYRDMLEADPTYLQEEKAVPFFREYGLQVKEGTWEPEQVREHPTEGELFSTQKFLGMQLLWTQGPNEVQLVPFLPEEDWLKLILVPRASRRYKGQSVSWTQAARTRFDRLRGYLVTGAFSNPNIAKLIGGMINHLPAAAVLMEVRADSGRGEKPELQKICGEDFSFPSSEGLPDEKWCQNLYFSESNQWPDCEWHPVYPTLTSFIQEVRKADRTMLPTMVVDQMMGGEVVKSQLVVDDDQSEEEADTPEMLPYEGHPPPDDPTEVKVKNRSEVVRTDGTKPPRTKLPTSGTQLYELFRKQALVFDFKKSEWNRYMAGEFEEGTKECFLYGLIPVLDGDPDFTDLPKNLFKYPVLPDFVVSRELSWPLEVVTHRARKAGMFVYEIGGVSLLSLAPVAAIKGVSLEDTNEKATKLDTAKIDQYSRIRKVVKERAQERPAANHLDANAVKILVPPKIYTDFRFKSHSAVGVLQIALDKQGRKLEWGVQPDDEEYGWFIATAVIDGVPTATGRGRGKTAAKKAVSAALLATVDVDWAQLSLYAGIEVTKGPRIVEGVPWSYAVDVAEETLRLYKVLGAPWFYRVGDQPLQSLRPEYKTTGKGVQFPGGILVSGRQSKVTSSLAALVKEPVEMEVSRVPSDLIQQTLANLCHGTTCTENAKKSKAKESTAGASSSSAYGSEESDDEGSSKRESSSPKPRVGPKQVTVRDRPARGGPTQDRRYGRTGVRKPQSESQNVGTDKGGSGKQAVVKVETHSTPNRSVHSSVPPGRRGVRPVVVRRPEGKAGPKGPAKSAKSSVAAHKPNKGSVAVGAAKAPHRPQPKVAVSGGSGGGGLRVRKTSSSKRVPSN